MVRIKPKTELKKREDLVNEELVKVHTIPRTHKPKAGPQTGQPVNKLGFFDGTDMAIVAENLLAGGESRIELTRRLTNRLGRTRTQGEKNVSLIITNVLIELEERGYRVESSWKVVPPENPGVVQDLDGNRLPWVI